MDFALLGTERDIAGLSRFYKDHEEPEKRASYRHPRTFNRWSIENRWGERINSWDRAYAQWKALMTLIDRQKWMAERRAIRANMLTKLESRLQFFCDSEVSIHQLRQVLECMRIFTELCEGLESDPGVRSGNKFIDAVSLLVEKGFLPIEYKGQWITEISESFNRLKISPT